MSYLSKLEFIIHPLSSFCSSDQEGLLKRGMPITTPIGSIIVPTNQYKTFQCTLSSLTRFSGNFPEGHSSYNYSKPNMLNYGVLK
ncbi:hypothetical protein GYH30_047755 [Glycine max]|uniref:Uncharacterized protein n=2 Tax=Glycine subgen. Soja TaxID=1462606 RepID=A0A0R0FR47_SOYBN|nr:hypothetical protein JHK87_047731 [Glycine soja]KAH1119082.1 hypothetical protein GYH30_047755 [Glycine max]RZB57540.1 hypothetical protein D0Y65_046287 [Glycine soja]